MCLWKRRVAFFCRTQPSLSPPAQDEASPFPRRALPQLRHQISMRRLRTADVDSYNNKVDEAPSHSGRGPQSSTPMSSSSGQSPFNFTRRSQSRRGSLGASAWPAPSVHLLASNRATSVFWGTDLKPGGGPTLQARRAEKMADPRRENLLKRKE